MSRHSSKTELKHVIRRTAATDHLKLGTPLGAENFNLAQLIRECDIKGDQYYGYYVGISQEELEDAIKRAVRAAPRVNKKSLRTVA